MGMVATICANKVDLSCGGGMGDEKAMWMWS